MPLTVVIRRAGFVGLVVLLGSLFFVDGAAQSLSSRIDDQLRRRQAERAFWGLCVYDIGRDSILYRRNARRAFLPASNQKLVTTAAALDILGSTYRYETTLSFRGAVEDSVMRGDLILKGSGDPSFGSTAMRGARDPLQEWAGQLADMGVRRIEGRLIADDEVFSGPSYPDGWNVNYLTRQKGRQVGIRSSGLSYRDNVVRVMIRATQPGDPPELRSRPPGVVELRNQAVTSSRWQGSNLVLDRTFSTNEIVLSGSVARTYRGTRSVPVSNPTTFALVAFANRLRGAGIETDLVLARIDTLAQQPNPENPLFVELSPPLSEIVQIVNKRSNNFYAEQLFRTYGWNGSVRGAIQRTETFLEEAGVDPRHLSIQDGSGLSRKNLITPCALTRLLVHMDDHSERRIFLSSMPRGGERNTTLDGRLAQTSVRAKTGSLAFARTLSGFARRPDGSRIAFAILANNYTGPSDQITETMDAIVRVLASPPR